MYLWSNLSVSMYIIPMPEELIALTLNNIIDSRGFLNDTASGCWQVVSVWYKEKLMFLLTKKSTVQNCLYACKSWCKCIYQYQCSVSYRNASLNFHRNNINSIWKLWINLQNHMGFAWTYLVLSHFGTFMCSMSSPISPELVLFPDFWVSNIPRYFCFASLRVKADECSANLF